MTQRFRLNFNGATMTNKVSCIKAVRVLSGLGLKEAKDLVEGSYYPAANAYGGLPNVERLDYGIYVITVRDMIDGADLTEVATLRREGVRVEAHTGLVVTEMDRQDLASLLKQAAIIAIKDGDVNKAIGILQLV